MLPKKSTFVCLGDKTAKNVSADLNFFQSNLLKVYYNASLIHSSLKSTLLDLRAGMNFAIKWLNNYENQMVEKMAMDLDFIEDSNEQNEKKLYALEKEQRQLFETISVLREQLEGVQSEADARVQETVAATAREIIQLKETAAALRDKIDVVNNERDEVVQKAVADASSEIKQLKDTVAKLRDELEGQKIKFEEEIQSLKTKARDEENQLKRTIQVMRDQIEAKNV